MRVCILSCLSESWFFLDQQESTDENQVGAERWRGERGAVPCGGSAIKKAVPGALLLNRDGNQAEKAARATPSVRH